MIFFVFFNTSSANYFLFLNKNNTFFEILSRFLFRVREYYI